MRVPDDSGLLHADPSYDPQKAHEYYLRTRHLKGRKKGVAPQPAGPASVTNITYNVGRPKNTATQATTQKRRQEAQARVAALQKRLDHLHEVLAELVKQAKARSGVETKPQPTNKKTEPATKKNNQPEKPKTAAQKKEAAAKAKDAYKKEHPQSLNKQEQALQAEVKQAREKILKIRAELKASVERARKKAAVPTNKPVTAPRR